MNEKSKDWKPECRAFVLLSGGLDSTTALYKAIADYAPVELDFNRPEYTIQEFLMAGAKIDWVEAVSIDYGQRHTKEITYARGTCTRLGIPHTVLDVGNLLSGKHVMLSRESVGSVEVPDISYSDIVGVSPTYVPFRNGLLLSAIVAHAQKWVNNQIGEHNANFHSVWGEKIDPMGTYYHKDTAGVYFGAHSEDAANWAYPDCTPEFIGAMANAIYVGTYNTIRLHTPLQWLMKDEIVTLGSRMGVPFQHTWSCYKGEELHCGVCPTCRSRKEAFAKARCTDPTEYTA